MLSAFQKQRILEIERANDFRHWCAEPTSLQHNSHEGPKQYTWYTKDMQLHTERVGQMQVLNHVCFSSTCKSRRRTSRSNILPAEEQC